MKNYVTLFLILIFFVACKMQTGSNRIYDAYDPNKVYKLHLNPPVGSVYHYDIINESDTRLEVEDKKVNTETKTTAGVNYNISKDSIGNFLFAMNYDKVQLYSKSGETETNSDADGPVINNIDKMLGMVKATSFVATITSAGEIKNITGYKELGDKILAGFDPNDTYGKDAAKKQWEKMIGDGLVKKNLDQLFKIFPDSAIHLRDTWKLNSTQGSDLGMNVKSVYTLKAINSDVAIISMEGKITSDSASAATAGINSASVNLQGQQHGEFEMETKTGMLIHCTITAEANGTVETMSREAPVTIRMSVKVDGRKMK